MNRLFGIGRALVPQIYFKAPTILVRPRKPQFEQQAKILESIDAWLVEHIGLKASLKLMILDAFLTNIGVGKVGYHSISTELPTPAADESLEAVADLVGAPVREVSEELVRRRWSYHDYIRPDTPWFLRVSPQDVLVPPGFIDEHEAPWVAFRVKRPLEDVLADPVYSRSAKRDLKADARLEVEAAEAVLSPQLTAELAEQPFVNLYEIWDKRDGTLAVLNLGHDVWLRPPEEHGLEIVGAPLVVLRFNPDGVDFWGVSDAEQIRQQILELIENRTMELVIKKRLMPKGLLDKNLIDRDQLDRLESGEAMSFVLTNGPPANAFAEFQMRVPPDLYRVDDLIDKDIREIVGFSRNQAAEFDVPRRTATEAEIVREAFLLRADERRDLMADLLAELFRDKIHPMIFQYWSGERVIEVTSLGGWVKFTGAQIRGDYDVLVVPDSTLPVSKRQEQAAAQALFGALRGDPRIRQDQLYARLLTAFRDVVPDPSMLLLDEEEFQRVLARQTQVAMLQRGAPKQPA